MAYMLQDRYEGTDYEPETYIVFSVFVQGVVTSLLVTAIVLGHDYRD